MALSDLQVFEDYVYDTYQPLLDYNFSLFNQATQGGLVLTSSAMLGDFSTEALWNRISGLVVDRDPYTDAAQTSKQLAMSLGSKVKVAKGMPPIDITPSYMSWIQKDPEEAGAVVGKQLAEDTIADMLNVAVNAYVAALTNVGATVVHDGTAATATLGGLLSGAALFGDKSDSIACWMMHSKTAFDIYGQALANSANLFTFGNIKVMQDGFGRPFIVTDTPGLVYTIAGPATRYHVLGLTPGAVVIGQQDDYLSNIETSNGRTNIRRTMQAEWSYEVGLKGYSWNKVAGGHAPNLAALSTGTNWPRISQVPLKLTAGVMVNFR